MHASGAGTGTAQLELANKYVPKAKISDTSLRATDRCFTPSSPPTEPTDDLTGTVPTTTRDRVPGMIRASEARQRQRARAERRAWCGPTGWRPHSARQRGRPARACRGRSFRAGRGPRAGPVLGERRRARRPRRPRVLALGSSGRGEPRATAPSRTSACWAVSRSPSATRSSPIVRGGCARPRRWSRSSRWRPTVACTASASPSCCGPTATPTRPRTT